MIFRECDVRYENFSGSGPGGQYRNRHANCIRAIHEPTGVIGQSTSERSASQNKILALANLRAKFARMAEDRRMAEAKSQWEAKPDASYGNALRTYRMCGKDQGVVDSRTTARFPTSVLTHGDLDGLLEAILKRNLRGQVQVDGGEIPGK